MHDGIDKKKFHSYVLSSKRKKIIYGCKSCEYYEPGNEDCKLFCNNGEYFIRKPYPEFDPPKIRDNSFSLLIPFGYFSDKWHDTDIEKQLRAMEYVRAEWEFYLK